MMIRGVIVQITCDYCKGERRLPGGRYKKEGEVVNCPRCNGQGHRGKFMEWSEFITSITLPSPTRCRAIHAF